MAAIYVAAHARPWAHTYGEVIGSPSALWRASDSIT